MDTKSKAKERFVIWMMGICDADIGKDDIWYFRKNEREEMGTTHDHNGYDQHEDIEELNMYI